MNRWTQHLFTHVVTHPIAVGMIFVAMLVFGLVSYQRIPVELMPDIGYPTVTVRTTYDGAALRKRSRVRSRGMWSRASRPTVS